jgi:hydrogenase/urease accessory protein HupE
LLVLGLLGLSGPLAAHPILYDDWAVNVLSNRLEARFSTSLHEVAVGQRLDTNSLAAMTLPAWLGAASNHANYISTNLAARVDGVPYRWKVMDFQVQSDSASAGTTMDDLDSSRALIYLASEPFDSLPKEIALSHSILRGYSYAPGIAWSVLVHASIQSWQGPLLGKSVILRDQTWTVSTIVSPTAKLAIPVWREVRTYVTAGLFHVWEGWDHLLFLLGMVLAVRTVRELSLLILIFTAAHSLTITLSTYGLVRLSSAIVEPGIAASIVVVAILNLWSLHRPQRTLRYWAAGTFGLLHGMGFASGLLGAAGGIAGRTLAIAIASFCVGVELAHAAVGIPAFVIFRRAAGAGKSEPPRHWVRWGSVIVALGGLGMLIQAVREYW